MSFLSQFQFSKTLTSPKTADQTLQFLKNFEVSVGQTFPGLDQFSQSGNTCKMKFKSFEFSGMKFELTFNPQIKIEENRIEMGDRSDNSKSIVLKWKVEGESPAQILFEIELGFTVPLPSLTRKMVEPLIQRELTQLVERYCRHVEKALG